MMFRRVVLTLLVFSLLPAAGEFRHACFAETKAISVDRSTTTGAIDIILGTNRNPLRYTNELGLVDMTAKLHDVGITYLRTHGIDEDHSHPTNLEGIFPDWQAAWWSGANDPYLDPANYNFDNSAHSSPLPGTYSYVFAHSTDGKIDDIINNGFTPLFRFGYRPNTDNKWDRFSYLGYTYMPNPIPDTDVAREKVGIVCENILKHYNEGWEGGRSDGIEFWEVWNEPDIKGMWGENLSSGEYNTGIGDGTLGGQFRKMYAAIATRIRGTRSTPIRPGAKIGTCALAWTVFPLAYHESKSVQFLEELLQYCNANDVPLDFYSWHSYGGLQAQSSPTEFSIWYGGNAWVYLTAAKRVRTALDGTGYPNALSVCDEWNSLVNQDNPYHDTDLAAAFTACALMYMDYADVYMSNYFPMVRGWGMFDEYANYTKEAYAHKAFSLLRNETPDRLDVTNGLVMDVNAGTADNFAVMAGRSGDGNTIRVLLADEDQKWVIQPGEQYWLRDVGGGYFDSNAIEDPSRLSYDAVSLTLNNLPPDQRCTVTYRTIDGNGTWVESGPETYFTDSVTRSITLERPWTPPAVCLVRIEMEDRYTGVEGSWDAFE